MERLCRDKGNFLSALSETWIFLYSAAGTDPSLFPLIPNKFLSIEKKKIKNTPTTSLKTKDCYNYNTDY